MAYRKSKSKTTEFSEEDTCLEEFDMEIPDTEPEEILLEVEVETQVDPEPLPPAVETQVDPEPEPLPPAVETKGRQRPKPVAKRRVARNVPRFLR